MSLPTCLAQLQAKGALDAERAARFAEMYAAREAQYAKSMAKAAAAARASSDTMDAVEAEALQRRRQELLQIKAQQDVLRRIGDHVAAGGRADIAAIAVFAPDERVHGVPNLEMRHRQVLSVAHAQIAQVLETFSHDVLGRVREPARLANLVREAFGEATDDVSAAEMAKAWTAAAETLRQRFNAAGGHIGKRDDWGLPQGHSSEKVGNATFEEWRDFIAPRLDPARMVDETTGQPFTAETLPKALAEVYQSIRSQGWAGRDPGGVAASKLANRRADPRFLVFRSADDWMQYQERFGTASAFDAMMGHIDGMARDIAQMEILGPNPSATVRWLTDLIEQDAMLSGASGKVWAKLKNRAFGARRQILNMHGVFTGELNRPVDSDLAYAFGTARSLMTAAKLGGATVSATTDLGFQEVTAAFNGLEFANIVGNYAKLLNPADATDRKFALASGLIADEAASRMGSLWRYDDSVNSPEVARRLANGVLRASGLSAWTQAGKWAFGMEFMHAVGHAVETFNWDRLDPRLRHAFERYGIGAADWERLRMTPTFEHKGASFLRPVDIEDEALARKYFQMIATETRFAIPEAGLRARGFMSGGTQAGTPIGEILRSVLQFKGFAISMIYTHGMRTVLSKGPMSRAKLLAHQMFILTALGGAVLQFKAISGGRDPRDMTDPWFWTAAMAQGGGLGIAGDFLFTNQSRAGGVAKWAAGPLIGGTGQQLYDLTLGNAYEAADGEQTNIGREAVKFAQMNTPGSSLWYGRLALNRLVFDQLQIELDPDHERAFERMEQRAAQDFDQAFWWHPGETAPERAPELEAVAGGSE